jgi:membrane-associated HD superfamily phosphohydrolase
MAIAYSHLGDVTDRDMMFGGVVLFAVAPTIAFILAVYAARAGHRSGKIAVIASGLLLLATLVVLTVVYWWVGLPVTGVVAVLVLAWVLSRRIAVVLSGLLLLAILLVSAWLSGGWINVAVIAVIAVVSVPVFAWLRSHFKRDSTRGGRVL